MAMDCDQLPDGWKLLSLGDPRVCTEIRSGFACGEKEIVGGVPHLRMNNISANGRADFSLIRRIPHEVADRAGRWLDKGDVLFCNTNSTELVGKACLFPGWKERCTFSNHLTRLRANRKTVLPAWLLIVLRHLWRSGFFATNCREFVGQSAYNQDKLRELLIPIPPLAEQRRIVARIEELTTRLRQAAELHSEAERRTAGVFQAALESAFSEREIADWPKYEAKRLFSPVKGQVDPREHPYVDMPHVGPDSIESGTCRLLPDTIQTPRQLGLKSGKYLFSPQHVLYSKIRPALRKVALPNFAGVCSADMYPLLPNTDIITREFLALCLLSPGFTQYAVDKSVRNAIPKINRKTLLAFEMPVPSKKVQAEIVRKLFGLQAEARKLAQMQRTVAAELNSIPPALLAKAFRGEL